MQAAMLLPLLLFFTIVVRAAELQSAPSGLTYTCREHLSAGKSIIFCVDTPTGWTGKDLLSLFAIVISVGSLVYSYLKDQKARRQSVNDDFWLRTVIEPITIGPLIKTVSSFVTDLPEDCSSKMWNLTKYEEFRVSFTPKFTELTTGVHAISLLDKNLCKTILQRLELIEDSIIEYCASNVLCKRSPDGNSLKPRVEVQNRLKENLVSILQAIKNYQLTQA